MNLADFASDSNHMNTNNSHKTFEKYWIWLAPVTIVVAFSAFLFISTSLMDYLAGTDIKTFSEFLFYNFDSDSVGGIDNLAEVQIGILTLLIGVLGLTMTVVAIVVQLASQRFTPKLIDLFLEDRINIATFLTMVSTSLYCIWVVYSIRVGYVPIYGSLGLMLLTTFILGMLIPYFRYVFQFLTPSNILYTIERNFTRGVIAARAGTASVDRQKMIVNNNLETIADIARSAVNQIDRNVSLLSIDSLANVLCSYISGKQRLPEEWYRPHPENFISISSEFFEEITERRVWVEARGLIDLELIFTQALRMMPDAISAIATKTREVAMAGIKANDDESAYLCIEYLNTFLRRAINDKNQRAIFSLMYQYRRLAEDMLPTHLKFVNQIAFFFQYYGQESLRAGMPFLMIAAAMDIGTVLQRAYELNIGETDAILDTLLSMAHSSEVDGVPFAKKGVLKSHIILATHLFSMENTKEPLGKIEDSLRKIPADLLIELKTELLGVTKRKFWEITDRGGVNFEYLEPEKKIQLTRFYDEYLLNGIEKS